MRALALCAGVMLGGTALADTTPGSTISQLMLLEPGDASYKLFHGAVWLDSDKATTNYRWGGLECKGRDLGDASVQILYASYRAGDLVKLEYVLNDYKDKQYRCVTGFTISKS